MFISGASGLIAPPLTARKLISLRISCVAGIMAIRVRITPIIVFVVPIDLRFLCCLIQYGVDLDNCVSIAQEGTDLYGFYNRSKRRSCSPPRNRLSYTLCMSGLSCVCSWDQLVLISQCIDR